MMFETIVLVKVLEIEIGCMKGMFVAIPMNEKSDSN